MPILHACINCGRLTPDRRCPQHRRQHARKAAGRTGARGSTWSSRKRRQRVLAAAKDAVGIPRCFYCREAEATIAEHFVPLKKGGTDDESNLVASCADCNRAKGTLMPGEFLRRRAGGPNNHGAP